MYFSGVEHIQRQALDEAISCVIKPGDPLGDVNYPDQLSLLSKIQLICKTFLCLSIETFTFTTQSELLFVYKFEKNKAVGS